MWWCPWMQWLPCPLPYQQEGLWLHELVQDVEVGCTSSCHEWIWVKFVGGVTLKNSLVLLLLDPHQLDGNPWSCSSTWWSRTWWSLGNPLDQGLRCFFKWVNLFLKLVLAMFTTILYGFNMIWVELTRTDAVFSRTTVVLFFVQK